MGIKAPSQGGQIHQLPTALIIPSVAQPPSTEERSPKTLI